MLPHRSLLSPAWKACRIRGYQRCSNRVCLCLLVLGCIVCSVVGRGGAPFYHDRIGFQRQIQCPGGVSSTAFIPVSCGLGEPQTSKFTHPNSCHKRTAPTLVRSMQMRGDSNNGGRNYLMKVCSYFLLMVCSVYLYNSCLVFSI